MPIDHPGLVELGVRWLKKPHRNAASNGHSACSVVLDELVTAAVEIPDVIGWTSDRSIVIEAKTSVADFRVDARKPWRSTPAAGMGDLRYFLCEPGVIPQEELPEGWGLLHAVEGRVAVIRDACRFREKHWQGEMRMLVSFCRRQKIGATTP
jgi:hypothetical protein